MQDLESGRGLKCPSSVLEVLALHAMWELDPSSRCQIGRGCQLGETPNIYNPPALIGREACVHALSLRFMLQMDLCTLFVGSLGHVR